MPWLSNQCQLQSPHINFDMGFGGGIAQRRIAILGLGLMGGSLALSLKGQCEQVWGYDPDRSVLELADRMALADRLADELGSVISEADIIILAAPVCSILELLDRLPERPSREQVVLDIGSTKMQIMEKMKTIPAGYDPIGGHPICGKEKSSLENADPVLFQEAVFVLVPNSRTSPRAKQAALDLLETIGSIPLWMDPEAHDAIFAATSHFPYLLSNTMAAVTPIKSKELVGPGFRSTARLAGSSPGMMADIILSNRANILKQTALFQEHLRKLQISIETGNRDNLIELLNHGADAYRDLVDPNT